MGVKEAIYMSQESLASPLLDGFRLGAPMSERPGVQCCPAMKENSDQKYIVKILSMPASQVQLDALLVTGAYKDPAAALDYFRQQADDTAAEAEFLQSLSKLEGFAGFEGWQVVPMKTNRLGYQVFLVSTYGRTLEKAIRRTAITQLQAVNLAIDLCAALSLCRRAGYLYIDLKPSNIMVEGDHFKIADLGFVSTKYLNYSSMPERYVSAYTAPEVKDPMSALNTTLDTYALGMILYRLFNGGVLPELPDDPARPLPAPANADEAMAQIILKACAPKPEDRWQDPAELGQAIVTYMELGTVGDTPISQPGQEPATAAQPEVTPVPEAPVQEVPEGPQPDPAVTQDSTIRMDIPVSQPAGPQAPVLSQSTMRFTPGATAVADVPEAAGPDISLPQDPEIPPADPQEDVIFPVVTAEAPQPVFDLDSELSEVNDILKPQAPRYPTMTPRPVRKPVMENVTPVTISDKPRSKAPLVLLILVVLVCAVGFFAHWFYNNFYLQPINALTVSGTQDELVVTVDTPLSDSLLTVHCTDVYGNSLESQVEDGKALFTGLSPNSLYNILVTTDGLHKLTGQISDVFTTEGQTEIVNFTATSGQDEGYVMLNLTVNGHDPESWVVSASCEGEDNIMQNFTGHSVTLKGLTVGKEYTFQLYTSDNSKLAGQTSTRFKVVSLVTANNMEVISRLGGDLTVGWEGPANITVDSWTVRCYADNYDQSQTVTGTIATFTGTSNDKAYTIEVTAAGQTEPTRLTISANPITVASFDVTESDEGTLDVSWTFDGTAPADGWLLVYSLNNSETSSVVKCSEPKGSISPMIPDTTYHLTLQLSDDTSIFNSSTSYTTTAAEPFSTQGLSADKIKSQLLKTPSQSGWLADDVASEDYTTVFQSGDKISMVLEATVKFYVQHEDIQVMYVYRDSAGNPIPALVSQSTIDWYDLFFDGNYQLGELDLPKAPTDSGSYSVTVYFNGAPVASNEFVIS